MHRIGMERRRLRRDIGKMEGDTIRREKGNVKGVSRAFVFFTRGMIYRAEVLMRFKNNGDYPHYSLAI